MSINQFKSKYATALAPTTTVFSTTVTPLDVTEKPPPGIPSP